MESYWANLNCEPILEAITVPGIWGKGKKSVYLFSSAKSNLKV